MRLSRRLEEAMEKYAPTDDEVKAAVLATQSFSRKGANMVTIPPHIRSATGRRSLDFSSIKKTLESLVRKREIEQTAHKHYRIKRKVSGKGIKFVKSGIDSYDVHVDGIVIGELERKLTGEKAASHRAYAEKYDWSWVSDPEAPIKIPEIKDVFSSFSDAKKWVSAEVKKRQR